MSRDVDRYQGTWANIALCADTTWTTQPQDEFIIANQRLLARHCRISQFLQETASESQSSIQTNNQVETKEKSRKKQDNSSCSRSVKDIIPESRLNVRDVIPESRLAKFYGNFYYDEVREKCYTNDHEKTNGHGYNGRGCENSDPTECWMLPEVEYLFRKLVDSSDRSAFPHRHRQYKMLADDDFERWGPAGGEEATLAARVLSVRNLWDSPPETRDQPILPRAPSPPPTSRKIRARRRQPKRLTALPPPPPAYCVPTQLICDPITCKVQFDWSRPPQLNVFEYQRAMGRLSSSVQAVMQASAARCPPYRGTNVSRYAPTAQRPTRWPDRRYGIWWPRDHPSPRLDNRFQLTHIPHYSTNSQKLSVKTEPKETEQQQQQQDSIEDKTTETTTSPSDTQKLQTEETETQKYEKIATDDQAPSTSAAALATGLMKKRLYSTVLSMSAPPPINLTACVRLSQKLVPPGLLKLNPKILLPTARIRPPKADNKFEELEKEALEQYKASDESIDTKLSELEKQAEDQYSTSNSNTSCSSGNSAEKTMASSLSVPDDLKNKKQSPKFNNKKVDSVVIYSQNFPDLNTKAHNSVTNLKNCHTPPRGEKKEQTHRPKRSLKNEQRAASDTDYEAREATSKHHKGPMRWSLHAGPPKKRHLTLCVSDYSSDEDLGDASRSIKDAGPCIRRHVAGKVKMSAHGGGDLVMRKT